MNPRRQIRFQKYLLFIYLLLFSAFNSFSSAHANSYTEILVMIDSSKSTGKSGIEIAKKLLGQPATEDELASRITVVTYPTSNKITVSSFRNSAEFTFFLQSLSPIKGSIELGEVFNVASTWAKEYSDSNRFVYWISDGGGLGKFQGGNQVLLAQMSQVTDLENWAIFEVGTGRVFEGPTNGIATYEQISRFETPSEINFPQVSNLPLDTTNAQANSATPAVIDSSVIIATSLALLTSISVYFFFLTIKDTSRKRESRIKRATLVSSKFLKSLDEAEPDKSPILKKIPTFFQGPIDQFGERFNFSEKKQLNVWLLFFAMATFLNFIVFQSLLLSILIAFFVPAILFRIFNKQFVSADAKNFSKEFPGFLTLLSSGLKSGLSLEQNIDAYCQQSNGVLAKDFRRVISEGKMGASLDESLDALVEKRNNDDLTWLVTAISIQRGVGGSLSSIIDTVLETIKARAEVRREIKALSAEGKLSAYVLIALPIFIFLFLVFTRRSYVEVLWTEAVGRLIFVVIALMISIGWFWMRKVVNIKV